MSKVVVVSITVMILLLALAPFTTYAIDCTSPGSGSSSDYPYDAAANTYVVCTILSAQATIMALPTNTPDIYGCYGDQNLQAICLTMRQWTPTPTSTATPNAAQAIATSTAGTIALQTGCTPDDTNAWRSCVINDSDTRANSRVAFWAPLVVFTLLITAVLRFKS
jgi:hypothetical protein